MTERGQSLIPNPGGATVPALEGVSLAMAPGSITASSTVRRWQINVGCAMRQRDRAGPRRVAGLGGWTELSGRQRGQAARESVRDVGMIFHTLTCWPRAPWRHIALPREFARLLPSSQIQQNVRRPDRTGRADLARQHAIGRAVWRQKQRVGMRARTGPTGPSAAGVRGDLGAGPRNDQPSCPLLRRHHRELGLNIPLLITHEMGVVSEHRQPCRGESTAGACRQWRDL